MSRKGASDADDVATDVNRRATVARRFAQRLSRFAEHLSVAQIARVPGLRWLINTRILMTVGLTSLLLSVQRVAGSQALAG